MAFDEILLRPRDDRGGFDVDYRPAGLSGWLLGRGVDDALGLVGEMHGTLGVAHQIAFARALDDRGPSAAREAVWNVLLLAEDSATEARRFRSSGELRSLVEDLVEPVLDASVALKTALGATGGPRSHVAPCIEDCRHQARRLLGAFTALVVRLSTVAPSSLHPLSPEARTVVETASANPLELMRRLRHELPLDMERLRGEPAMTPVLECDGVGSVMTASGRITYGVRIAAGCVSRIGYTTPTHRLFKPGGVAVHLLDRFAGDRGALAVLMASLDPEVSWALVGAGADA